MTTEIVLMFVSLTLYTVATALFVFGVTFTKDGLVRAGVLASAAGLAPEVVSLGIRWTRTGHGPYIGYYEVANGFAVFVVALYLIAALRDRRLAAAGVAIMPVAVLLLGGAMLTPTADLPLSPTLASWWLFIHVAFANLAFAAFVASFALALAYVAREHGKWTKGLHALPVQEVIADMATRFAFAGFLFWTCMIVSGAIWANEAWGRYWGWDPIETWSLIVWIIYALYLHVRFTMGWRGERLAWFAMAAMPIALFALLGIPLVYQTAHGGYIGGTEGLIQQAVGR